MVSAVRYPLECPGENDMRVQDMSDVVFDGVGLP